MYIDPFLAGVLATVIVEAALLIIGAIRQYMKGEDDEDYEED